MTFPHPRHASARGVYGELPSRHEMRTDARAARDRLRLDQLLAPPARTAVSTPTLRHPVQPPGPSPAAIRIDQATARLAGALSLHLD